jgi:hypothetical protein
MRFGIISFKALSIPSRIPRHLPGINCVFSWGNKHLSIDGAGASKSAALV